MRLSLARTAIRLGLGALFLWAAGAKIAHPLPFFNALLDYDVPLPDGLFRFVAMVLPWLEALCGLALLFNIWPETVRPVVSALCGIFVVMLGQAAIRGLDLSCGCFGSLKGGWMDRPAAALVRAALLLGLSLVLLAPAAGAKERAG